MFALTEDIHREFADKYQEPRLHIEALLRASIVTLDLPAFILYRLDAAGVRTVGDLLKARTSGLSHIHGIGSGAVREVEGVVV